MAKTFAFAIEVGSGTNASSYATSAWTPVANRLYLASVESNRGAGPEIPTLSGNSLTWVQVATLANTVPASDMRRLTLFRAMGASPTNGATTADFGGVTQLGASIYITEISGTVDTSGTDGSGAIVQSASATTTTAQVTLSATLAAFGDAANGTFGCLTFGVNEAATAGSGFTLIGDGIGHASPPTHTDAEGRDSNDTTVDFTWTSGVHAIVIAVEIKDTAAGGPTGWGPLLGLSRNRLVKT